MALFHSIWTIVLMILFVGIVVWAWSRKRRGSFDKAARVPLEDEADPVPSTSETGEQEHG